MEPKFAQKIGLGYTMGIVPGLRHAIENNDLVGMRRLLNGSYFYFDSFSEKAQAVREYKPPDNEQLNMFSFLLSAEEEPDEGEWDAAPSFTRQL